MPPPADSLLVTLQAKYVTPQGGQIIGLLGGKIAPDQIAASQWDSLIDHAIENRMGTLLANQLAAQAALLPPAAWAKLAAARQQTAARYLLFKANHQRIEAVLRAAGIQALWLKGYALIHSIYPAPTLRPMSDLDLLIKPSQRAQAQALLTEAGYRLLREPDDNLRTSRPLFETMVKDDTLLGQANNPVIIEMHHRLFLYQAMLNEVQTAWFWQPAQQDSESQPYLILRPEAQALYLAAHILYERADKKPALIQFYDLHLLFGQPNFNWDAYLAGARYLNWAYIQHLALNLTRQLFNTTIPAAVLASLAQRQRGDNAGMVRRLNRPGYRLALFRLRLLNLTLGQQAQLLLQMLLPPRLYMRKHFGKATPMAYLRYWRKGLVRN
jgi:Uncharacterised nucleotidyltransferase